MTDPRIRAAAYHLISIWQKYDRSMSHACESRGEDATDFLQSYGWVTDQGWQAELTPLGEELMRQGNQMNIHPLLELPESLEERRELHRRDYQRRGCNTNSIEQDVT